jgi:hypothetical protein
VRLCVARAHHDLASTSETLQFISPQKGGNSSMSETSTLIGYSGRTIGREELVLVPTPPATETHRPIPHHEIIGALIETLGFRHIGVVNDEYAVSPDGMKQEHAIGDDLWLSRVRVLEHGIFRGFYPGAGETLKVAFADRLHRGRR